MYNKFEYNEKKLQVKEFTYGVRLDLYDFGVRMFLANWQAGDVQVGRWSVIVPLTEKFAKW